MLKQYSFCLAYRNNSHFKDFEQIIFFCKLTIVINTISQTSVSLSRGGMLGYNQTRYAPRLFLNWVFFQRIAIYKNINSEIESKYLLNFTLAET